MQLLPAASVAGADELLSSGQVDDGSNVKFVERLGLLPLEGGDSVSGAVPSFSSVTVCVALVWPTTVAGKASEKTLRVYTASVVLL